MPRHVKLLFVGAAIVFVTLGIVAARQPAPAAQVQPPSAASGFDSTINQNAQRMLEEGRKIFRYELEAVVNHYDNHFKLRLTAEQKRDLIEYLKSI